MFWLHETTTIRSCRIAFCALCLAPSCAVLAWVVAVHLPAHHRAHEQAISTLLGCEARVAQVSSPLPGATRYEWLELWDTDASPRQLLARLPLVEVSTTDGVLVVRLLAPAIVNGVRMDAFWNVVREKLQGAEPRPAVRCEARSLAVHLGDRELQLLDVRAEWEQDGANARMALRFRTPQTPGESAPEATLSVIRDRESSPAETVLELSTPDSPLPCALLDSLWPGGRQLGGAALFQGRLVARQRSGIWETELSGRASQIDLDILVSRQFPHRLSGLAEVQIERARIVDGRLESAAGTLTATDGLIGRSLLQATRQHLQLPVAVETSRASILPYRQLCAMFEIDEAGLVLRGGTNDARGALVVAEQGVLAREATLTRQPLVNLVRALVPATTLQVPATLETAALARVLPLSTAAPLTPETGPRPAAQWVPAGTHRRPPVERRVTRGP